MNELIQMKDELNALVEVFNTEVTKFIEKGNKAAATRARKTLLEIGKMTKTARVLIQESKTAE